MKASNLASSEIEQFLQLHFVLQRFDSARSFFFLRRYGIADAIIRGRDTQQQEEGS